MGTVSYLDERRNKSLEDSTVMAPICFVGVVVTTILGLLWALIAPWIGF